MAKKPAEQKETKKTTKATKTMRKTIQEDVLVFKEMTEDGILATDKCYSIMYRFPEANFITETDEVQLQIAEQYSAFMNAIPDGVTLQIVIVNIHTTTEELERSYHLPLTGKALDQYVEDYNTNIIDVKLKEGANDIKKEKYAILTAKTHELKEARALFQTAEIAMQDKMKAISGLQLTRVNALERVEAMKNITYGTGDRIPFGREYSRYIDTEVMDDGQTKNTLSLAKMKRTKASIKDMIAPPIFEKTNGGIRIGETRYAKTYVIPELPTSLDTKFVTAVTNLDHETVTILRFAPLPRDKANRLVKMMNVNIKADVQKDTRRALQNGLDPEVTLSEDLLYAREEAANLRRDVVQEGKRLFLFSMTTTLFGEDPEELTKIFSEFKSRCADNSVSPNPLYGLQTEALRDTMLIGKNEVMENSNRLLTSDDVMAIIPWNIQDLQDRKHGLFYGINAVSGNAQMINRRYLPLGNGLIFGQAGSGKSFFAKCEIAVNYLASDDDDFVILDPENEFTPLAKAYNGAVVDISMNSESHINPLDMNMEWSEKDATPLAEKCDLMVSIVESILGGGRECNAFEVAAIHAATEKIYAPYIAEMNERREKSPDPANEPDLDPNICPTLIDFYEALKEQNSVEGHKISQAIQPYCIGQYNAFAHRTNIDPRARICVFQLVHLPEKMKEMAMKVCLSHIWTRVVKNRQRNQKYGTAKRLWVYLDEFHLFMQTSSARTSLIAYYKRVRKYGAIMTGITQDVADIVGDIRSQGIFSNTGFFVYFHQSVLGQRALQSVNNNNVSDALMEYVSNKGVGVGLLQTNGAMVPINFVIPRESRMYQLATTKLED